MRFLTLTAAFLLLSLFGSALLAANEPTAEQLEFFEKSVRPLLIERCHQCHGANKQEGNLRLDSPAAILKGGDSGPPIVAGKPDESVLVAAIRYGGDGYQMPPKGKLKDAEIATLTRWVELGAPWPKDEVAREGTSKKVFNLAERAKFWSFQPLRPTPPPTVKLQDWPQSPVDRFILARLEASGLSPALPADKRTLIRRVTYDLIGLPPTPAEIDSFLADESPTAFSKVVERLLASPHYGERWARHWMDLVRFAETCGHEFDFEIVNAYRYRDYLIRAFNDDLPYKQFVVEHVAGDLLPHPRRHPTEGHSESLLATGFYYLGEAKHSPVDIREDEAARVDNQVDVFTRTFLGLTVACARCHDHKFDAITTKDYYALAGYLRSSRFQQAFLDSDRIKPQVAQLEAMQAVSRPLVREATVAARSEQLASLAKTLLAVRAVLDPRVEIPAAIHGSPTRQRGIDGSAESIAKTPDVVFEDFEKPNYEGWTTTGEAFGAGPNRLPLPVYQGDVGAKGKGLVNSHSIRKGDDVIAMDALTGTLTSKKFNIQAPYVRFLIGGGAHAGKTCLNLYVDGKVQRTATGKNENRMQPGQFDVREFQGREAHLELVDQEKGGWGNIGVDQIVFSHQPGESSPLDVRLASAALHFGVDAQRLPAWVKMITDVARPDPRHPLYLWGALTQDPAAASPAGFAAWRKVQLARLQQEPQKNNDFVLFEDFNKPTYANWFVTGEAFGEGPNVRVDVELPIAGKGPVERVIEPGQASSGRISPALRGVLRSQTFTIQKKQIHYLAAGKQCQINLIIDNFQRIQNPIYGGLTIQLDQETPTWRVQDVSMWVGQRGYIELIDHGTGSLAVDEIRFSDVGPTAALPNRALVELLDDPTITSAESLAAGYQALLLQLLSRSRLPGGTSTGTTANDVPTTDRTAILSWILRQNALLGDIAPAASGAAELAKLLAEEKRFADAIPVSRQALAMADGTSDDERVFIRGNHKILGETVPRRFLEAIAGKEQPVPAAGSGRLALAERMVDSTSNPFLPRVLVNRVWHHHFAAGIVPTPDDFGFMGQPPTHPELLDYLATEFVKQGWSIKQLHRTLVLSSTYQMASRAAPAADLADPRNELLHRMPIRRLEAEAIRDAVLAVSGRLDPKLYGPSIMPHLTMHMLGRGRPGNSGPLDGDGRRSIYINVRRNFLSPLFLAFDYPTPFSTMGRRSVSNVPAQALAMMNNPFIVEQARLWAKRVSADPSQSPEQRIQQMYVTAFGRPADDDELAAARSFLAEQATAHGAADHPQAWTDLAHVLLNVKEFIFIN